MIVFIKENKPGDLKGPQISTPATLNQNGCMYTPHVLAVQTGQPVIVANGDPFLQDVHGQPTANKPFNFIQVNVDRKTLDTFTAEETFQIKCDVHPWMKAVVRVFDHPYFTVTGEDGKFTIDTETEGRHLHSPGMARGLQDSKPKPLRSKGVRPLEIWSSPSTPIRKTKPLDEADLVAPWQPAVVAEQSQF